MKRAGQVREQERRIGRLLEAQPLRQVGSPLGALLELTSEVVRWKDFLAGRLDELEEMRFTDDKGSEQLRSEVALFERALDRCGKFLLDVARLNVDERMARISEQQASMVAQTLRVVIVAAGLRLGEPAAEAALTAGLEFMRRSELAAGS